MAASRNIFRAAAAAALVAERAAAVNPLIPKGQYLFDSSTGNQFFIKGVAYQQGIAPGGGSEAASTGYGSETTSTTFIDSLADSASCTRDVPLLKELGTNTIRVYAVNPDADHSSCMATLDAAGIYVIADMSVPGEAINRDTPAWTTDLYTRYTGVINNLAQYPNTLGFFAGNEVTNNKTNSDAAAYVKAAVRDTKAYIKSKGYDRWLGVGYATNDDADTRDLLASYFNCGPAEESVDFWGYNIYEWCGKSTFEESGYKERTEAFKDYSVPPFFSEYACNSPNGADGRTFEETVVLYSDLMNKVWCGGVVYEFFQEQNDYGLVELSGTTVTKKKNFAALASAMVSVNANTTDTGINMNTFTPTNQPRSCPPVAPDSWLASDMLPPTPNVTICENMVAASSCVPAAGLSADATAALFGTVCGLDATACKGISSNATTGVYGAYVMCNATQQLTNALNTYYTNQKKASTACDFNGQAVIQKPTETLIPVNGSTGSESTGNGTESGAQRIGTTSVLGNAGWAGSFLAAIGAVAILAL